MVRQKSPLSVDILVLALPCAMVQPHHLGESASGEDTHIPLADQWRQADQDLSGLKGLHQEGLAEPEKLASRRGAVHIVNIRVCKYFVS